MLLRYKLTDADCRAVMAEDMRVRINRPLNLLLTYGLALLLLGACFYVWRSGLLSGPRLLWLSLGSLALSAANIYFRLNPLWQARQALRRAKRGGHFGAEFFQEHSLRLEKGKFYLRYGKVDEVFDCCRAAASREIGGGLLLYNGEEAAEYIPSSAFANEAVRREFMETFYGLLRQDQREFVQEQAAQLPEEPICRLDYSYDAERFLSDQRTAARLVYSTKLAWPRIELIRLAFCLFMIYYALSNPSPVMLVCCFSLVVLLNSRYLISFTPLGDRGLRKSMAELSRLGPNHEAAALLTFDTLFIHGDLHFMRIPLSDIVALRENNRVIALYLKNGGVITIPKPGGMDEAVSEKYAFFVGRIRLVMGEAGQKTKKYFQ